MYTVDLDNKVILVTGASRGIGYEIAKDLIRNGASVAVHYNNDKTGAESLLASNDLGHTKLFKADLSKETEIYRLYNDVLEHYKRIDTVILNAGVFLPHSDELQPNDWYSVWKKTIQINLNAVGLLTKLFLDHYLNEGKGRFIYMGSRAAFRGETSEYLAYAASKGGLTSLAKSVARSYGKKGITSFVIAPGFTRTEMADQFIRDHGEDKVLSEIALGKLTAPKDIAPIVSIMSAGLLDHATGATFDINAGSYIR